MGSVAVEDAVARLRIMTVYQPWASLIASGDKPIENRGWVQFPSLLGAWVGIHAARARRGEEAVEFKAVEPCLSVGRDAWLRLNGVDDPRDLPRGAVVGFVRVTGLIRRGREIEPLGDFAARAEYAAAAMSSPFYAGGAGYVLSGAFRLPEPVPFRGGQGIRKPTPEVVDAFLAMIGLR